MRIAYIVSRFPLVTETFILREFDALDRQPGIEVELYSLFGSSDAVVHAAAEPWLERVHRGSGPRAALALVRWLVTSPQKTLALLRDVIRNHRGSPRAAGRALVTTALALQHTRDMRARQV